MAEPGITPLAAIVCEDIRREENGKLIAIGIFPEVIVIPFFPIDLRIALLLPFTVTGNGSLMFQVEIRAPRTEHRNRIDVAVDLLASSPPNQNSVLALPPSAVRVEEPGDLSIFYRNGGAEWQMLRVLPVMLPAGAPAPSAAAISQPQPS